MTTEFILLMVAILLVAYSFAQDVSETFIESGARLAARVERDLTIGQRLRPEIDEVLEWRQPPAAQ